MKSQLSHVTQPGTNHTGIASHPELAASMLEGAAEFGPTSSGGAELLAEQRVRIAKLAYPVGTMPPAPEVAADRLPLLDKLGARLQFERTAVRLYEALISKYEAYGTYAGGPSREELVHVRDEEHQHVGLAQRLVVSLGGDPTVLTPCANIQAVASRGVLDVLVDARTTLVECLDAMLIAELTDHATWEELGSALELANELAMAASVREAERVEGEHLAKVRGWIAAANKLVACP